MESRLFLAIVLLFASLIVSAAPVNVDMTRGVWTITAFDIAGNDWSGSKLTFETQAANGDDLQLSGYFEWTGIRRF